MKHYGNITQIHGATVEPVNVIIGGSPCQDLSVAGKQKGIKHTDNDDSETTRSGLFMEQLRIIKEMRCNDIEHGRTGIYIRPRFMVWENVPGAFSSNKGADFAIVLEETIKVADEKAPAIPVPKHGWPTAGCITDHAGKWSVSWRVFDAQFWGVPQRRKRIALVADFGGLAAPEILFERESVCGDIEPSRPARESVTAEAEGCVGAAVRAFCIQGNAIDRADTAGCNGKGWTEGVSYTLNTVDRPAVAVTPIDMRNATRGGTDECGVGIGEIGDPSFTLTAAYCHAVALENHPADSRIKVSEDGIVQTLSARMGTGGGNVPLLMEAAVAAFMGGQGANAGSIAYSESVTPTIRADAGGNSIPMVMVHPSVISAKLDGAFMQTSEDVNITLLSRIYKDPPLVCYPNDKENEQANSCQTSTGDVYPVYALDRAAFNQGANAQYNIEITETGINSTLTAKGPSAVGVCNNKAAYGVVSKGNGEAFLTKEKHMSLTTGGGQAGQGYPCAMTPNSEIVVLNDQGGSSMNVEKNCISPTLRAESHNNEPIVFHTMQDPITSETVTPCLSAGSPAGQATVGVNVDYTVRRLTPLECERLQGYPDGWTLLPQIDSMGDEVYSFWCSVLLEKAKIEERARWNADKGIYEIWREVSKESGSPKVWENTEKPYKHKTPAQMLKWYNKMVDGDSSDAARYKAIGNSIALPPWVYVLQRLSVCCGEDVTMASLFDGIGGFPLIWERLNGAGSCLWSSEIEEFPIAVTMCRFNEVRHDKEKD